MKKNCYIKKTGLFTTTAIVTMAMSMASFAGTWHMADNSRWWFLNDDGLYLGCQWMGLYRQ